MHAYLDMSNAKQWQFWKYAGTGYMTRSQTGKNIIGPNLKQWQWPRRRSGPAAECAKEKKKGAKLGLEPRTSQLETWKRKLRPWGFDPWSPRCKPASLTSSNRSPPETNRRETITEQQFERTWLKITETRWKRNRGAWDLIPRPLGWSSVVQTTALPRLLLIG